MLWVAKFSVAGGFYEEIGESEDRQECFDMIDAEAKHWSCRTHGFVSLKEKEETDEEEQA